MSTGDIDNTLGPEGELDRLRKQNVYLDQYLRKAWLFKPIKTFFILYGAGISEDGSRVYISYDIQSIVDGVECEQALVIHETTEWALREYCGIGEDYAADPTGHRLANRAEFECVNSLLAGRDDPWELYSEVIDEQVLIDERHRYAERPIPQDLALYPYEQATRSKLIDAMYNDRSTEEWEKLQEQAKPYTKEESEYTDNGSEAEHCSICNHYVSETECRIVQGQIVPDGWCKHFANYDEA